MSVHTLQVHSSPLSGTAAGCLELDDVLFGFGTVPDADSCIFDGLDAGALSGRDELPAIIIWGSGSGLR
jgi:hypothetical protein